VKVGDLVYDALMGMNGIIVEIQYKNDVELLAGPSGTIRCNLVEYIILYEDGLIDIAYLNELTKNLV
tara:strand:+ start:445 stop:645 length:201 start_codon:yes stop_codon:yes gene_type:complete